jgi:urease accessory protein
MSNSVAWLLLSEFHSFMTAPAAGNPAGPASEPPVLIVTRKIADSSSRPAAEQISLTAERRLFLKRRWRGAAEDGMEFGFDLESRLHDGCVIHQTADADYVMRQEHEPVYVVRPRTLDEAALLGWRIGNLHMPVEITGGELRAAHDPAVRQLLEREGWAFEECTLLFNPLRITAHAS